jgi:hypothetical protein
VIKKNNIRISEENMRAKENPESIYTKETF